MLHIFCHLNINVEVADTPSALLKQQPAAPPTAPQQRQQTGEVTPADAAGSTAAQEAHPAAMEPQLLLHLWVLLVCAWAASERQQVQLMGAAAAAAAVWLVELCGCNPVPAQAPQQCVLPAGQSQHHCRLGGAAVPAVDLTCAVVG
jgi:hypothetical protein